MLLTDRSPDGEYVDVFYMGGFIFLAYLVSVMGCTTTLELLHRRTSRAGLYNWYLLLTSSITMGGVGIWCMHYIGNRAIVLGDGAMRTQIIYSMKFTGVSFVLPVIVLLIAFYCIGASEKASYFRIVAGGILTGGAVCGMHYIGQLGISNYTCTYRVANVVGAAIIAVFASTVALTVFFRWRATWTDSWWRRGICGCVLALAVSGMHWTAAVGTYYYNHDESMQHNGQLSRSQVVIICAVLACAACGVLTACAVAAGGNRRRLNIQARQLVLTCAFFDQSGRIMVTPHALLPSRKIVDRYIGKTFNDDDLTRSHPAFLWAFRASRHWNLVKDVVPFMRSRIETDKEATEHYIAKGEPSDQETELQSDFDELFKRHFCVTAQDLADEVRQPLPSLGKLYDDVLITTAPTSRFSRAMGYSRLSNSKGQMLFTVRHLEKQEANRLAAAGFRFTPIENVTSALSNRMHIPLPVLGGHLKGMRDYATGGRNYEPGVHLVSFVMRPTISDHFEVLTAKGTGNPLPSATLPIKRMQIQHLDLISHMEGWTISTCLTWLKSEAAMSHRDIDDFREHMIHAMTSLASALPPDINMASKFSARPLIAPCRTSPGSDASNCILLSFCAVGNLDTQVSNPDFTFMPLRLFRTQQQLNDTNLGSEGFAKELGRELYYSNARSSSATESDVPPSVRSVLKLWPRKHMDPTRRDLSQETLTELSQLGDIMVRKEVKVDVAKLSEPALESSLGRHASHATVVAGDMATSTYVDELYNLCYSPGVRLRPDTAITQVSNG
ncbi:MHYT domain signaling protein [Aspergillus sclerotioniger CBS 115572]|uniref:MHYT domain signaling protein n=1 Tax=Aspergillus sclerotioniger CBS 115572 TaxID=1450535 RepID=A0A317XDL4_9EURO|nr:MHYT domain signaling protein [Aspergillus sclerotioniger CBS 115572]PWY96603.1 MHYT domain signaling protein [Aspergillus sclerotioniger CBS 115572]